MRTAVRVAVGLLVLSIGAAQRVLGDESKGSPTAKYEAQSSSSTVKGEDAWEDIGTGRGAAVRASPTGEGDQDKASVGGGSGELISQTKPKTMFEMADDACQSQYGP